ncbi:MAG: class aldolase/adducin family protein [Acidobacteria bacterium]|nr:class aldolase/adducin family protein [Acidobacteriota bacterium]
MKPADLTAYSVVSLRDIDAAVREGAGEILIRQRSVMTPSAREAIERHGLVVRTSGAQGGGGRRGGSADQARGPAAPAPRDNARARDLFHSPEAEAIKAEIVRTGKKLWQRQYVDGNGGNISYRIGPNEVICTPTLCSKADLTPEVLCLVDLEGNELVGSGRTSEIFLHLQVYKEVPQAKAVVHCHPPHATAYAVIGRVPPSSVIPEYDVFVGRVACTPYETPGTKKFAETVIPYIRNYNTVLLGHHGIVCWADTVTHAEWYAEVLETYCWTLTIAAQLGGPVTQIPQEKEADLLRVKKRLGLPDPRFNPVECRLSEMPPPEPGSIVLAPPPPCAPDAAAGAPDASEIESVVRDVTDAVMAAIEQRKGPR